MAISAKFHNIPFIVAAPVTSIDLETPSGNEIRIEERPGVEVVNVRGLDVDDEAGVKNAVTATKTTSTVRVAADGIKVWNPSFDVCVVHSSFHIESVKALVLTCELG